MSTLHEEAEDDRAAREVSREWFAKPPLRYRPSATVRVGDAAVEEVPTVLQRAIDEEFGSVLLFPAGPPRPGSDAESRDPVQQRVRRAVDLAEVRAWLAEMGEDTTPAPSGPPAEYLSEEYFRRSSATIQTAAAAGMTAVLYDELGYPSGFAGGGRIDPEHYRKLLVRTLVDRAPAEVPLPPGRLLAAVGLDESGERRDVTDLVEDGVLRWTAPGPAWRLQLFCLVTSTEQGGQQDYHAVVDYFDRDAVQQFVDVTYEAYAAHLGDHLGTTITTTFFDDVGIFSAPSTWSADVDERFRELTGRDAATYYPALWEDIGPETVPARVAFFRARAELLSEGFPAIVSAWAERHGVEASGHCPGQYEVQPTDMCADPFVFYRAQPVPMIDVIYKYGFGREGYKLTTSAADALDKPTVLAEQFTVHGSVMGFRRTLDSLTCGVNRFIAKTGDEVGPPGTFARWAGRLSMLMQGGRRVSDIAVVYPIRSLQAFYRFDAPDDQEGPVGRYAPPSADYLTVGDRLTGDLRRDFTFVHPDDLESDRFRVGDGVLVLDNAVNRQEFRVVVLPGTDVVPVGVLRLLRRFQRAGGVVLGTTALPTRSAEFGHDDEVRALVEELFATATFVPDPTVEALADALDRLAPEPDVSFAGLPRPHSGGGRLSYLHKVKAGHDVVLLANSSDDDVTTTVSLRGARRLEIRDPMTGEVRPAGERVVPGPAGTRTEVPVVLPAVSATVLVGTPA